MAKNKHLAFFEEDLTEELIIKTVKQAGRPLSLDELLKILSIERKFKKKVTSLLHSLEASSLLLCTHKKWFLPNKSKTVTGIFRLQRSGAGFVIPESGGGDIFIPQAHMNDALDEDTVSVMILPGRHGPSREGRILNVISTKKKSISAHAVKKQRDGKWKCLHKGTQNIFVVDTKDEIIHPNDLLIIVPKERKKENVWEADFQKNVHKEETPFAQEILAKANKSIPLSFSSQVMSETASLPENPEEHTYVDREDLRHIPFVTIDGPDAKDFDDAIFVEKLTKGFRLLVAIADVAHYVALGSAIDKEAFFRGNSYYFPLSVEPMLPHALSNTLCSLKPDVPRLVMVADMTFDASGQEVGSSFYPAVICSKARLTYDQVLHDVINGQAKELIMPVLPMLKDAVALATIFTERREQQGSLNFDLSETSFAFDDNGNITGVQPRSQHFAHKLIEVFMVAANESVARFMTRHTIPTLYRIHPAPSQEKLESLTSYLVQAGLLASSLGNKQKALSACELNAILHAAKNTPQEYVVNRLILRTMMQAKYSPENEGHYGLSSTCYCHFTSPIRRYADLVVHRALKAFLGKKNVPMANEAELLKIADHINQTERTAMEAEREVSKRLTILFLKDRIGEEFIGTISGVTDFGIFVEIPSCLAEGMVRLSALKDDYYDVIPERHLLRGRQHGKTYALGDQVTVTLTDVNIERLEINFTFLREAKLPRKSLKVTFLKQKKKKAKPPQTQKKKKKAKKKK